MKKLNKIDSSTNLLIKEFNYFENSVKKEKNKIINFLRQLIRIPSQNGINDEKECAHFIKDVLNEFGIKVKIIGKKSRPSLMSKIGKGRKTLILNAHLDTVPTGDIKRWRIDPFEGKIIRGKLYGRGAADSKAGIAQIVYATKILLKKEDELNGKLVIAFDSDEESGNFSGMKTLLKEGLKGDFCLIAYPGNDEIMIGSRGLIRFSIKTFGETVHTGSRKRKGKNAIYEMIKVINFLSRYRLPEERDKYFCFGPRLTVSMIKGGTTVNVVPDECEIKVDIRTTPSSHKMLLKLPKKIKKTYPSLHLSIKKLMEYPPYRINETHEMIKILLKVSQKVLKKTPILSCSGAANVGNLLAMYGIPSVCGFGAKFGNVHSYNEWVSIKSVIDMTKLYSIASYSYLTSEKE